MQARKGVFSDCEYSGMLNCDVFKVCKKELSSTVVYFSTDQESEFSQYFLSVFGPSYSFEGKVESIYGKDTYVVVENKRYSDIRIKIQKNRATLILFESFDDDGNSYTIYSANGSAAVFSEFTRPYHIQYYKDNALVIEMNNLGTAKPTQSNIVWNNGGVLSIS